jgi:hypothetical protein
MVFHFPEYLLLTRKVLSNIIPLITYYVEEIIDEWLRILKSIQYSKENPYHAFPYRLKKRRSNLIFSSIKIKSLFLNILFS